MGGNTFSKPIVNIVQLYKLSLGVAKINIFDSKLKLEISDMDRVDREKSNERALIKYYVLILSHYFYYLLSFSARTNQINCAFEE